MGPVGQNVLADSEAGERGGRNNAGKDCICLRELCVHYPERKELGAGRTQSSLPAEA